MVAPNRKIPPIQRVAIRATDGGSLFSVQKLRPAMKRPISDAQSQRGRGRPTGSNRYGEPTFALRVPLSRVSAIRTYLDQCAAGARTRLSLAANEEIARPTLILPLIGRVAAGQPIGADAHVEREIAIDR